MTLYKKVKRIINMGQLSKKDLFNEFEKENGLRIRLGIKDDEIVKSRVQASSYDLTPSIVAMSVKKEC